MKGPNLLVLGVALTLTLGVATAGGSSGSTSKPVKGSVSGSYVENFLIDLLGGESTGKVTHLGRATLDQSMSGPTFKPSTFDSSGTWTLTVANGDQLTGTSSGTCTRSSDFVRATCVLDLISTGGTGRLEGASATFTATTEITQVSCAQLKPFCNGVITSELVGNLSR